METKPIALPQDLDASRLSTYDLCPRKYHNQYLLNLHEGPQHLNTRFSTYMIHEPLTLWYLKGSKIWRPSQQEWDEAWAHVAITSTESVVKANAVYSVENAVKLFDFYTQRFMEDHDRFQIKGIENYILDKENFARVPFGSKPDISAIERSTGYPWTLELKFSGWDFILEAATMNMQFLGQVNNTKGKGCVVTLIQPVGAKWTTFTTVREELVPKPEELEEWRQEIRFKIASVIKSHETGVFPKNAPHACSSYGGCFFLDLCAAGMPTGMVDRMPRRDDPLGYLGGGLTANEQGAME